MPKSQMFEVTNMSFNIIHENKILAKISEFTVASWKQCGWSGLTLGLGVFHSQDETILILKLDECWTWAWRVPSSRLTKGAMLCPYARHFLFHPLLSTGSTQEDRKTSQPDWKNVDWDIKDQLKIMKLRPWIDWMNSEVHKVIKYCKTLIFGRNFYLALLAVKTKNAKIWDCEIQFQIQSHNKQ